MDHASKYKAHIAVKGKRETKINNEMLYFYTLHCKIEIS